MERGPGGAAGVVSKLPPPGVRLARPWRCGTHSRPSELPVQVAMVSGMVLGGASELPEGHVGPIGGSFLDQFGVRRALKVNLEEISR